MKFDGRKRVIIENVGPAVDNGEYPVKRIIGEPLVTHAEIFTDGHDEISALLLYKPETDTEWKSVPMRKKDNDRWESLFVPGQMGMHVFILCAWIDHFSSWCKAVSKKAEAGQDLNVDLKAGIDIIRKMAHRAQDGIKTRLEGLLAQIAETTNQKVSMSIATGEELRELMSQVPDRSMETKSRECKVWVDRPRALFSSWYEFFPRSCTNNPEVHGTLKNCEKKFHEISEMGFNVVYFPPIHPIGRINRKGKNNSVVSEAGDPGSPWAIGSDEGGHKSIHPALGTLDDFLSLVETARSLGMEIALDIAFQCAPDHPYVKEHPEWFKKRPDGSIQYAENPPKKYEDIVPFNFECDDWQSLWKELKSVIDFWIDRGITIFRVDNPHTKAFPFWKWLITEIKKCNPDVLFLAEAFTRPSVMQHLAKIGFSQSYTYFTWRNTKWEITQYLKELTTTETREYFRPNFWPNTPDILPEFIQYGGRPAFVLRLLLAATLCSNYGIYGPAFELCVKEGLPDREEYADSEKYEIKKWELDRHDSLKDLITRINTIRNENAALQSMWNITFFETDNEFLLCYAKTTADYSNVIFVIANLDPFHIQRGWVQVPFEKYDIPENQTYQVYDLLSNDKYVWHGRQNYVELNPAVMPVHIFKVHRRLKREHDFDYYL